LTASGSLRRTISAESAGQASVLDQAAPALLRIDYVCVEGVFDALADEVVAVGAVQVDVV
jgi:hypothetical protein